MSQKIHIPLDVTESRFEALVLRWAMLNGWMRHHARPAQTSKGWRTPVAGETGFPDLVLARSGSPIIFAELKTEKTSPSPDQRKWLTALAGGPPPGDPEWASRGDRPTGPWRRETIVQLWRPRHWPWIEWALDRSSEPASLISEWPGQWTGENS